MHAWRLFCLVSASAAAAAFRTRGRNRSHIRRSPDAPLVPANGYGCPNSAATVSAAVAVPAAVLRIRLRLRLRPRMRLRPPTPSRIRVRDRETRSHNCERSAVRQSFQRYAAQATRVAGRLPALYWRQRPRVGATILWTAVTGQVQPEAHGGGRDTPEAVQPSD